MLKRNTNTMTQGEIEIFIYNLISKTDVVFTNEQITKLSKLVLLLSQWSKALNLTAIKDIHDIIILHIIDSAVISPLLIGKSIADVGTGAGFPGLVIAILNEDKQFTLIDSVAKKLSFVRTACVQLGIKNVNIINKRCEEIELDTPFDCIVSRAFAPLERMVSWCLPLLKQDGSFIAMKANLEDSELNAIPSDVKVDKVVRLNVPNLDAMRNAVFLSRVV